MANTVNVSTTGNTVTITPQNTKVSIGASNHPITVTQNPAPTVSISSQGSDGNPTPLIGNTVTITPQNTNISIGANNNPITVTQGSTSVVSVVSRGPQGPSINTSSFAITGSDVIFANITSSGNVSASGTLYASDALFGDLTVNNITAQQYIISSSVLYYTQSFSSGSTIFGDTLDDTHQFTGSINVTSSNLNTIEISSPSPQLKFRYSGHPESTIGSVTIGQGGGGIAEYRNNRVVDYGSHIFYTRESNQGLIITGHTSPKVGIGSFLYNDLDYKLTVEGGVSASSFRGSTLDVTISSQTASIDCSLSNYYNIVLGENTDTYLTASNIQPGTSINVKITQPSTSGSLSYSNQFKFANGLPYEVSSVGNVEDIISFIAFDTDKLYGASLKNFI